MRFISFQSYLLLITVFFFSSCHYSKPDIDKELASLQQTGEIIRNDFKRILKETNEMELFTELLYAEQKYYTVNNDTSRYESNANGIFYNPEDDGGSAVYVSGRSRINNKLKNIVYFTSPLDTLFKRVVKKNYPLFTQAHFNEAHSYLRIYPYIDVLNQFDPKQDFNDNNLYYLADAEHNPKKKIVLIDNPYVDPAGRGWIISSIAPVYYQNILEGIVGIDVTIASMKGKYMTAASNDIMLLDSTGVVIMIDELKAGIFEMPPMKTHKYLESIKSNEYIGDEYNLLYSKNKMIRTAFTELLHDKKTITTLVVEDEKYDLIAYMIPELNWYIIKFFKES